MANIKDKKAIKELSEKWKAEMETRKVDWMFIGLSGLVKLFWWELFAKYRLIFFMQRCCDGMAHVIAWGYAKEQTKEEILETLKACGWE